MGQLLIKKVTYRADKYQFDSPVLTGGLNVIEGKNGHGKSTFMNFIYYGLGGKVDEFTASNRETHAEITKDSNNYVTLDIELNKVPYSFIRHINSNDITVLSAFESAKVYPLYRSKNEKFIFSDWIMSQIDISPIEVFQGYTNFIINFRDILRLIYYNQELNPKKIYKPSDADNVISDSELLRKIIFELVLGKTFSDYYSALAQFKEKEKQRSAAKEMLDEYIAVTKEIESESEDLNLIFLTKKREEKLEQLQKVSNYRESIKEKVKPGIDIVTGINSIKGEILTTELGLSDLMRQKSQILDELGKLRRLKEEVILEVTQISKIIHSHESLSLFSEDTCPYCLRHVERAEGHCVCGNEVAEEDYERFFYSSEEYSDILKSKQKSTETVDVAISACSAQAKELEEEIVRLTKQTVILREQLTQYVNKYEFTSNSQELKRADDTILQTTLEIANLDRQIITEKKRELLLDKYNRLNITYERLRGLVRKLEADAIVDIRVKIDEFNVIYNELMTSTLSNVRSAVIAYDDYMPVLDGGQYKEASASVSQRLLYFLTILKMSLINNDVKFPKFLLIDTPETAGVDLDNLMTALNNITKITEGIPEDNFQIILTTGIDKYPPAFKERVRITLSDQDKLLKNKSIENSPEYSIKITGEAPTPEKDQKDQTSYSNQDGHTNINSSKE